MTDLTELPLVCLVHIMSYLDPLSEWYLAVTHHKFENLYTRLDVQRFLGKSEKI